MSKYLRLSLVTVAFSTFAATTCFGEAAKSAGYAPAQAVNRDAAVPAPAPAKAGQSQAAVSSVPGAEAPKLPTKPYRTWIAIQRYNMENNGETNQPISNVRLEVKFPNGQKLQLPESGQFWPIGNGQVQEINRTFEVPWAWVQNDGFVFEVQMIRKGSEFLPCRFEVATLSQFNRAYVCKTDTAWQTNNRVSAEQMDKESIQVRVFTDLNSKPNEIPNDSIALK